MTKPPRTLLAAGALALTLSAIGMISAQSASLAPKGSQQVSQNNTYKPRGPDNRQTNSQRGRRRLGPRYRGGDGQQLAQAAGTVVEVLAPEDTSDAVGLTGVSDPTLFWFVNRQDIASVTLKINAPSQNMTLGAARVEAPHTGYSAVRLSALHIKSLQQGVIYRWFVEVTFRDGVTAIVGSSIRYQSLPSELPTDCAREANCAATALADQGYWYDALERLAPNGAPPTEGQGRELWRNLLADVGLESLP